MDPFNTQDGQQANQPLNQQPDQPFPSAPQPDPAAQPFADPTAAMSPQPPVQDFQPQPVQPTYQPDTPPAAPATAFQPVAPQTYSPEPQPMAPAPTNPIMPGMQPSDFSSPAPQPGVVPGPQALPDTSAQMPMSSPPAGAGTGKKKFIIIALVVVIMLALAGFAVAALSNKDSSDNSNSSTPAASSEKKTTKASEVTATSATDFEEVCLGNTISNAAAPGSAMPKPIALFEQSDIAKDQYGSSGVYLAEESWRAGTTNFVNTQLVGCFSKKSSTATGKKCEFKSGDTPVSIEQYSVIYNLDVYEAKTGKRLGTREVSGPVGSCPFIASYNKNDPKLFADPDEGGTIEAIRPFVTQ